MENRVNILNELNEFAPILAALSNKVPYKLPENYFDTFLKESVSRAKTHAFLATINSNVFTVSANYFDGLAEKIINKIRKQETISELNKTAPLLTTLSKENTYHVPKYYFDSLQSLEGVKIERKAKIISINIVRKWFNYTAAAVMAGVLVTGAFMYSAGHKKSSFDLNNEVNKLSDEELQNYLNTHPTHSDVANDERTNTSIFNTDSIYISSEMQLLSDEELQEYINNSGDVSQKNTITAKSNS
ncbi:MAG: hypothetical protein JSR09_01315 [Bacteroidetes bacterium]|nr:hypothetical protein [Bacteroidota bacterium]MBS1648318.1 hypothetical protein [Bacteroidota bacterium]